MISLQDDSTNAYALACLPVAIDRPFVIMAANCRKDPYIFEIEMAQENRFEDLSLLHIARLVKYCLFLFKKIRIA